MGKDRGWKEYFHDNRRYADLINGVACHGKQIVKESDLQEEDVTAKDKRRDILRKVAFGTGFVVVGIENQEEKDYSLPLRTMFYDVSSYEKQAAKIRKKVREEKHLETGEYLYGFKKDSKLHPLVTFILYAGKEPWITPNSLHDMLDFKDVPQELRDMVSDYKINIIDIRKFENTEVFQTDLKQVFDFIRFSTDKKRLLDLVENDGYYKAMDDDAFAVVTKYTNSKELVRTKNYTVEGGKNDVCKAIQDLMADSEEKGRKEGIEKGIEKGIEIALIETAQNLLDVLSDEVIAEKTGLSLEKVQKLRKENK
ncbi:MAG: Rpn family recombination-promoting nuclease/putative transposase [Agathobacter sp.]|nr:Rpn family recombination-promoting nuclease/putative transposase [Agathobacter sp.]